MHAFNTIILITALTLSCAALPSEGSDLDYYPPNSALSVPQLRFVLRTTDLVIAMLQHEIDGLNNNPTAKHRLLKKQVKHLAAAIKVDAEIRRRSR